MKLVKKWLFPVLTCLLVAGAALLPQGVSEARDAKQFGAVHAETMAADRLPVQDQEPPSLTDRIDLYLRWLGLQEAIPSFRTPASISEQEAAEMAGVVLDMLISGQVLSEQVLMDEETGDLRRLEVTYCYYILIWDPEKGAAQQEPHAIWELSADLGSSSGSLWMTLDAETGLPLYIQLYDPNMDQWLSPKDPGALPTAAENFFDLLGLEGDPVILSTLDNGSGIGQCVYRVKGTDFYYRFDHTGMMLNISPEPERWAANYIDFYNARRVIPGGT